MTVAALVTSSRNKQYSVLGATMHRCDQRWLDTASGRKLTGTDIYNVSARGDSIVNRPGQSSLLRRYRLTRITVEDRNADSTAHRRNSENGSVVW